MNIFYESFGLCAGLCCHLSFFHTLLGKKILEDLDERSVSAHEMNSARRIFVRMGKTQPHERFSGTRYTSHEADRVVMLRLRSIYKSLNRPTNGFNFVL